MGRDKAGLLMGQDTFLAHALRAVRSVCPETVISLRPDAPCRAAAEKAGKTVWDITVWDWSRPQSWATPWCATAAGGLPGRSREERIYGRSRLRLRHAAPIG